MSDFTLYDRNVDIVSAYEWLFTATSSGLPATVAHFERFPALGHPDGNPCTPDFSVLFTDGSAILGEIANIPQDDRGVDKLCRQIQRYDAASSVPGPSGLIAPTIVDVLLLVPLEVGTDTVRRVIRERMDDVTHSYAPKRRPVVVQFARLPDKYVFQRRPDDVNGTLHVGDRVVNYATFSDLGIPPEHFGPVKVRRAFMNDPIPALYLATVLWMKVWPSTVGAGSQEFDVTSDSVVRALRAQYGVGRGDDVRRAMGLLVAADLAVESGTNGWKVKRRSLRGSDPDVHKIIAERVADHRRGRFGSDRPVIRGRPRRTSPGPGQGTLFDEWAD